MSSRLRSSDYKTAEENYRRAFRNAGRRSGASSESKSDGEPPFLGEIDQMMRDFYNQPLRERFSVLDIPGICSGFRDVPSHNYFACQKCNKLFRTEDGRNIHEETVCGVYECTSCDYTTARKSEFESHQAQHLVTRARSSASRPVPWAQCSASRNLSSSKTKQHRCRECGKSFSLLRALTRHMKLSHGEYGRLPCPHCTVTFSRAENLKRHVLRSHDTAVTKYCLHCRCSGSAAEIAVHVRRVHNRYECEYCRIQVLPKRLDLHQESCPARNRAGASGQ